MSVGRVYAWLASCIFDLNHDGKVGFVDLLTFAGAYGTQPGQPNWNSAADFNGTRRVDFADLLMLAANYNTDPCA